MTTLRTVRVAAIQATPVILDAEATVAKAIRLLGEAADAGAELAVLPETFVSVYPSNAWARKAAAFGGVRRAVGADVARARSTFRARSWTSSPRRAGRSGSTR